MIALILAAGSAFLADRGPSVQPEALCKSPPAIQTSTVDPVLLLRPQDRLAIQMRRLGDLPKASKEIAVMRTVAGCAVPVGVSYGVERDGRFGK